MSIPTNAPAAPFMAQPKALRYKEAISILQNHEQYAVSLCPPVKPKGGEMFLISSGGKDSNLKNWNCDQYKWPVYDRVNSYPSRSKDIVIKKSYHKLSKTSSFQRHGWWMIANPHIVLVHYLGDESEYTPTPHGNCKSEGAKEFIRTCPSVLKSISSSDAESSTTMLSSVHVI